MSGPSAVPALPPVPRPQGRPFPSWPVWLVFALLLVPSVIALGLFGVAKDSAADELALQRDVVGHNLVLTGVLTDVETSSGLPKTSSLYEVTVPDAGDGSGEDVTVVFQGDEQWGFPPSSDYPEELSFLVALDDPPRAVLHGPVGSIRPVTEESVREAEGAFSSARTLWVVSIVVFWLFALGLPVLAVLLAARRRRAKKRRSSTPMI
ncbi:hypothetical protein [Herbiconiux sp. UC225_62]|uniref:hypothetical protein n=1 Tax=Herbiconiux sp. UC225_62 TaxID=3350168 RepID=UPI0036D22506